MRRAPFYFRTPTGPLRSCHVVALVDDFSRFLFGMRAVPTTEAVAVLRLLQRDA